MDFGVYMILGATGSICLLGAAVFAKALVNKRWPSNNFTPFDAITAHSPVVFHEEKQEQEEDDALGDDTNKNKKASGSKPTAH